MEVVEASSHRDAFAAYSAAEAFLLGEEVVEHLTRVAVPLLVMEVVVFL